jgi:hypothetical protein
MNTQRGGRGIALPTHNLGARWRVGGQRQSSPALPPGSNWYPLYRRVGRPRGRFGRVGKISSPPVFESRTVQPVASRYTDYALPATSAWVRLRLSHKELPINPFEFIIHKSFQSSTLYSLRQWQRDIINQKKHQAISYRIHGLYCGRRHCSLLRTWIGMLLYWRHKHDSWIRIKTLVRYSGWHGVPQAVPIKIRSVHMIPN